MPIPNYTVAPLPPVPAQPGDLWFDSTNQTLNVFAVNPANAGSAPSFFPISLPAIGAALNASVVSVGAGGFAFIPAVVGTLGVSLPAMPAGHVAVAYDIVNNQIQVIGSGGVTTKRSAAFT